MKPNIFSGIIKSEAVEQLKAFFVFLLLSQPLLLSVVILRNVNPIAFQTALFISGWFTWTFTEYLNHRFWMHSKASYSNKDSRHLYHHQHPTEIKITGWQRFFGVVISASLVVLTVYLNNYFTLFSGFFSGFVGYMFMHRFLHMKWTRYVFRNLHRYHIWHHCKYPNACYGISVIWWDKIFGTVPPANAVISEKVVHFYFGDHD